MKPYDVESKQLAAYVEGRTERRRAASLCLTKRGKEHKREQNMEPNNTCTYARATGASTEPLPCQLANDNRRVS